MDSDPSNGEVDYESVPLGRQEYISAIVHLYRGELSRATSWRIRLDNTTNWAVLTTAGILSVSFGNPESTHYVQLLGFALLAVFWAFEARRYRFADIWYQRVRKIEENFYGPILRRDLVSPESTWGHLVAEDLFNPQFKITRLCALRSRFLRNYWAIFLVQLFAWGTKVAVHPTPISGWEEAKARLSAGMLPWWAPLALMAGMVVGAVALLLSRREEGAEDDHWAIAP